MRFKLFIFFFTSAIYSCKPKVKDALFVEPRQVDSLQAINFGDLNYSEVGYYAKDTVTPSGWSVRYYVKSDSTRYSDLYIQWSNDGLKGLFKCESVLQLRSYFIPTYIGENATSLLFGQGCATGCSAILALSKGSSLASRTFYNVIDYDIQLGQVLHLDDEIAAIDEAGSFSLVLTDLIRDKDHVVSFHNLCLETPGKSSCIDHVRFGARKTIVKAVLSDEKDFYREKKIFETRVVKMD